MLAVPNFSAGRDRQAIDSIRSAVEPRAEVVDLHSDPVHDRSVFTLWAEAADLPATLAAAAVAAAAAIDMNHYEGAHPAVGATDVAPVIWLRGEERELAQATARAVAEQVAATGIPVFLYGDLASTDERRERAFFRRRGLPELRRRMASGDLRPDLGPDAPHGLGGATLVTARPPLAAFNLVVEGVDLAAAREVAAKLREAGGGPAGVRAIAIQLGPGRMQVSTNVHNPIAVPLAEVVEIVTGLLRRSGGVVDSAEIVGLVPEEALAGFPASVPIQGFDPDRQVVERRVGHDPTG
jgi:glutamate formiminotransferase